jgi:methylenetetrahydrofolate reductase (NADPH)
MKVVEHIEQAKNPLFSVEIVPPPRGRSVKDIVEIVKQIEPIDPPWIDVTAHPAGAIYNESPDGKVERKIIKNDPGQLEFAALSKTASRSIRSPIFFAMDSPKRKLKTP